MRRRVLYLLWLLIILSAITGAFSNSLSITDPKDAHIFKTLLPLQPKNQPALVVTRDGTIYLVDFSAKKILWSLPSGHPIYSSYQATFDKHDDMHNTSEMRSNFFIDVGADWKLYMHNGPLDQTELPMSVEDYLRKVPYISNDGGVTLGSKNSTLFLIDAESGQLLNSYQLAGTPSASRIQSPEKNAVLLLEDAETLLKPSAQDLTSVRHLLYITRKDYILQHTSISTGEILWNLAFSEIEAEFRCQGGTHKIFSWTSENPESEFDADHPSHIDSQLPCQGKAVVYRICDACFLGHPVLDRLGNAYSDGHRISLPAYYDKPALALVNGNPLALQDVKGGLVLKNEGRLVMENEDKMLLKDEENPLRYQKGKVRTCHDVPDGRGRLMVALPGPDSEDHGTLEEFIQDFGKNKLASSETLSKFHIWSSLSIIVALLCTMGFSIFCSLALKSQGKLNTEAEESKSQAKMLKKKRARRSVNKNGAKNDQIQGNISPESKVEGNERKSLMTFIDHMDYHVDGRRIGKLIVYNKEIAKGSNGTVVLEGIYDGRPVAVKRLVQTHHDVALKEIQNLIASDHHPNIVRWYGVEYDQDFVYLSLERCCCSLSDLIYMHSETHRSQIRTKDEGSNFSKEYGMDLQSKDIKLWKASGYPSPQLLKLMRDVVSGLAHLHELGIIHRDLKPQNVLIIKERYLCAKLSDMGISKRLPDNMSSLTHHPTGYGSSGWQAPEQLNHGRQTRAVDLFSLGCVLFFCVTGGKHPYGDNFERDVNIVNDRKDLFLVEHIPEAVDLLSSLLDPNPDLRPKASDILHHPFFWSPETRLSFLRDVSDRVELEDRGKDSELLKELECTGAVAMNGRWDEKMETAFIINIGHYRRYKYDSVRDLLRVVRNKLNHYRELPLEIQELLGEVPEGFDGYFSSRFPSLLIEVYRLIYRYCKNEEFFRKYINSNLF